MAFDTLPVMAYDLIMADPPWKFDNWSTKGEHKNASAKYDCMDFDAIARMPVGHLARPDCVLWLWATNPMLPQALRVMEAWGFKFKTAGTWVKTTSTGKLSFGAGYVLRSANEPFLIGTIGKPETARNVRSAIMGLAREHSRKPDEAFEAAVQLMPHARRLEMFSRQSRTGWDTWGNESTKFDESNQDPRAKPGPTAGAELEATCGGHELRNRTPVTGSRAKRGPGPAIDLDRHAQGSAETVRIGPDGGVLRCCLTGLTSDTTPTQKQDP